VVLDAYSRRVIGWALSHAMNSSLVVEALDKALVSRQPRPGLVHHSDQGSQYASAEYVDRLLACGAVLSMSRPGRPWENGRCESFLKTLKQEELDGRTYSTMAEIAAHVEEFIQQVYNPVRLHSALAYQSPVEFEQQQTLGKAKAWMPAKMSFPRHREIYSDGSETTEMTRARQNSLPWRLIGMSFSEVFLGGCSPAEPASAFPVILVPQQGSAIRLENCSERQLSNYTTVSKKGAVQTSGFNSFQHSKIFRH